MAQRGRGAAAGSRPAARDGSRTAGNGRPDTRHHHAGPDLATTRTRLRAVIEPIVDATGLDLEELTVTRAGRRLLIRVTVDSDAGLGHDELSDVSRDISAGLDAAEETGGDLTADSYTLEVSSPGTDRPLTLPRHWRRNVGRLVKVRVGEKPITARIVAVDETSVSLDVDGRPRTVGLTDLGAGLVQVEFTRLAELADEDLGEDFITAEDDVDDEEDDEDDEEEDVDDDDEDEDEDDEDEDDQDEDNEIDEQSDGDIHGHRPTQKEDGE
jgi:ribosome maturation factor RimP